MKKVTIFLIVMISLVGCSKENTIQDEETKNLLIKQGITRDFLVETNPIDSKFIIESINSKNNEINEDRQNKQYTTTLENAENKDKTVVKTSVKKQNKVKKNVTTNADKKKVKVVATKKPIKKITATKKPSSKVTKKPSNSNNKTSNNNKKSKKNKKIVKKAYSPQKVVQLATDKTKSYGKITLIDNLKRHLANGDITKEEYDEYYPYDGAGYYSVFVETDLNKASTTSGRLLKSEDGIAKYLADMLALESGDYFLIEYAGTKNNNGTLFYEFRCYRA